MTGPSIAELQRITDPVIRALIGAIRRMVVTVTSRALWQVTGYEIDGTTETQQAEPFSGIGFYARPAASGKPEAIVVSAAGAKSPAIVATRDEKTRAAVAGGLAADEAIVFSSAAVVHVRANGTVEIRTPGGSAVPLATLADVQALREAFNSHVHVLTIAAAPGSGGTGTAAPTATPAPAPAGTTVLKGQ
jgi:phage gp45-like